MNGVRAVAVPVAALALAAAAASDTASASCAPRTAVAQLAGGELAFVGRLIERRPDRLVFTVDEALKGSPGSTVEIPRGSGPPSSVDLNPTPNEPIGLAVHRGANGALSASDCDRSAPANLRAAAAAPDTDCSAPSVKAIKALDAGRVAERVRFRVRLAGAEGRVDRVRVDWGDGSARTYRLDPEGADPSLTVAHRFRRAGVRRVRARASARPMPACAAFGMPPRVTSAQRTLAVRVRRG